MEVRGNKKTYTVYFLATGGIDFQANNEDDAISQFAQVDPQDILDTFKMNGWEITEVIKEDE